MIVDLVILPNFSLALFLAFCTAALLLAIISSARGFFSLNLFSCSFVNSTADISFFNYLDVFYQKVMLEGLLSLQDRHDMSDQPDLKMNKCDIDRDEN